MLQTRRLAWPFASFLLGGGLILLAVAAPPERRSQAAERRADSPRRPTSEANPLLEPSAADSTPAAAEGEPKAGIASNSPADPHAAWLADLHSPDARRRVPSWNRLYRQPEALPALFAAAQQKPNLSEQIQPLLRLWTKLPDYDRPREILTPFFVDPAWEPALPALLKELDATRIPGTGATILPLLTDAKSPVQRRAVLAALAISVDPPPDAFAALLPLVFQEDPDLAFALRALAQTIRANGQSDLRTLRNLPSDLVRKSAAQLAQLPTRLRALASVEQREPPAAAVAQAAEEVLVALGETAPPLLPTPQIWGASDNHPDYPLVKLFDGVWETDSKNECWRSVKQDAVWIVLDFGSPQRFAGLRIWNYNGKHEPWYGMREITITVGDNPGESRPTAGGVVARGPGNEKSGDYSTFVPIGCRTGRYLRIQAASTWTGGRDGGMAELQILGWPAVDPSTLFVQPPGP